MSARNSCCSLLLIAVFGCSTLNASAEEVNLARKAKVTSSSQRPGNPAKAVADGTMSDESRWLAAHGDSTTWVELTFPEPANIGVVDPARRQRIEEVAYGAIDHVWGRNPRLAAAPALPEMGFPEVERGWPKQHTLNVCARLELCRGSISALPGSEMYPFNPEGKYRHAAGWVNYGASWCISLAYLKFDAAAKTTPALNK